MRVIVYPVVGKTTVCSPYGDPRGTGIHHGIDLCAPMGTPVLAVDNGVVRFGSDPKGGTVALLDSDTGGTAYFAHLSATVGDNGRDVEPGDVIGRVGMTGNAATTLPHLHFELWSTTNDYMTYYDPTSLLSTAQHFATPPSGPLPPLSRSKQLVLAAGIVALAGGIAYAISRSNEPARSSRARRA